MEETERYYRTLRVIHIAPGVFTSRNLTQFLTHDAFFFTQPLQVVVGEKVGSKCNNTT
jgi:hypothetical protein